MNRADMRCGQMVTRESRATERCQLGLFCVLLLCGALLVGCSGADSPLDQEVVFTTSDEYLSQVRSSLVPKVSADATKHEGVLTVGLRDSQGAPFVVGASSTASGGGAASDAVVDGLDVDIACVLADELGLRVDFVRVDNVRSALNDSCDVVMGVSPLEANGVYVMGNYAQAASALFRHGDEARLATAEEVRGARIAVQQASASQQLLRRLGLEADKNACDNLNDAFVALADGEVDFVACSSAAGAYLSTLRPDITFAGMLEAPTTLGYAVAASDDELAEALGEALSTVESNGLLGEACRPWLGALAVLGDGQVIEGLSVEAPDVTDTSATPSEGVTDGDSTDAETAESGDSSTADSPNAPIDGSSTETEVVAGSNAATL